MKVLVFVFLFTLLATSSAVTLKARARAVLKTLSENLNAAFFRGTFKSLLQLTDVDEYAQVNDVLLKVKDEINGLLKANQGRLNDENDAYNSQLATYESTITDLQNQIDTVQEEADLNIARRGDIQTIIQNSADAISQAVAARDQEKARRDAAAQSAQSNEKAIDEAIAQCNQAITLLQEVGEKDLQDSNSGSAAPSAFVEVKRRRLHNSLLEIEKKIKHINLRSPVAPFLNTLINVAQSSVNQDDIDQIVSLLIDLRNSLQAEREKVSSDDDEDAKNSQSTIDNLDSTIDSQKTLNQNSQDSLVAIIALIDNQSNQVDNLQESLNSATTLLNNLDSTHADKAKSLQDLIDRLTLDIKAIDEALSFLDTQMS